MKETTLRLCDGKNMNLLLFTGISARAESASLWRALDHIQHLFEKSNWYFLNVQVYKYKNQSENRPTNDLYYRIGTGTWNVWWLNFSFNWSQNNSPLSSILKIVWELYALGMCAQERYRLFLRDRLCSLIFSIKIYMYNFLKFYAF